MAKVLMKGNEAIAEAAIRAGCDAFFGYPITPQNEIPEYLSRELPKRGKVFLQSESELSAINMVMGASVAGARVMTSTSGPGMCLKLEAISYMCVSRQPAVIVDVTRFGPGNGSIRGAQDDSKMAGNGAYKVVILAPANVQEAMEMTYEAFDIADQYCTPVIVMADGMIGQMMEAVDFDKMPPRRENLPVKHWALAGSKVRGGKRMQMDMVPPYFALSGSNESGHYRQVWEVNHELETVLYPTIEKNECRYETIDVEDADLVIAAFGTASRMARAVKEELQDTGLKIGIIRPKTLWPFPYAAFDEIGPNCKAIICAEMNIMGLMIDDVKIAAAGRWPVYHAGNSAEGSMTVEDITHKINEVWGGVK